MKSRYGTSYDGKRQLAILFTFIEGKAQPVSAITKLIAAADNATLGEIRVVNGGSGYTKETLSQSSVEISPPLDPAATKNPQAQARRGLDYSHICQFR